MMTIPPDDDTRRESDEYQAERAHQDYEGAKEAGRAASQAAILINGGAATALLAFLSKEKPIPKSVIDAVSAAMAFYVVGVAAAAWAFWCLYRAGVLYAAGWERLLTRHPTSEEAFNEANRWGQWHKVAVLSSLACFMVGGLWVCWTLLRRGLQP
jgi:hypothetical protein